MRFKIDCNSLETQNAMRHTDFTMHENSLQLFKKYALPHFHPDLSVLEIGPDAFPSSYRQCAPESMHWETLDIYESEQLTYSAPSEYSFPIPDNQYDIVFSGQVMEHVRKIWLWVRELERVCKPNGLVIIITPISWPYHEAPVDCWRIYPEGMKALLEETSLEILHCDFESVEMPGYRRYVPGKSAEWLNPKLVLFYKVTGKLGFPVQRSYDMMTIARKKVDSAKP